MSSSRSPPDSEFETDRQKGAGGRPRGARNKVTLQIREAAVKLFDPPYWRKLRSDLRKRKLHPQMETTLLAYAFGKPVDRIEVGRVGDFSKLSDDELLAQFEATVMSLRAERRVDGEKSVTLHADHGSHGGL